MRKSLCLGIEGVIFALAGLCVFILSANLAYCDTKALTVQSSTTFIPSGEGATPSVASLERVGHVANIKDNYAAYGDGRMAVVKASIASGSSTLTVGSSTFGATDVPAGCSSSALATCKLIGIQAAGAAQPTGIITAITVTSPGSYAGLPSIVISTPSGPTTAAKPGALMGVTAATLVSAGNGCPASTQQTAALSINHAPLVAPTANITIGSGGTATGVVSVTPGKWLDDFPTSNLSSITAIISGCSVNPVVAVTIGLVSIAIGNGYYYTGHGAGYPLSGVTASVSGGSPISAATVDAPIVTPFIFPLVAYITGYISPIQITLSTGASTPITGVETNIIWGHVDTAALQAAAKSGNPVYVPPLPPGYCYITDEVLLQSNTIIFGNGASSALCKYPKSYNPMFSSMAPVSMVEIYGIQATGNARLFSNRATADGFISLASNSNQIRIHNTFLYNFGRHVIYQDGGYDLSANDNYINGAYFGAGIMFGMNIPSVDVSVLGNHIYNTQWAGISGQIDGGQISDNIVHGSNLGDGDSGAGGIQDCITGYTENPSNQFTIINNNWLYDCGNNGIHWGGDRVNINNNIIHNQYLFCILAARHPNTDPARAFDINVTDNKCYGSTNLTPHRSLGIAVWNYTGGIISGNIIDTTYFGIELSGRSATSMDQNITVLGNTDMKSTYCVWLMQNVQRSEITANTCSDIVSDAIRMDGINKKSGSFGNIFNHIGTNNMDGVAGNAVDEIGGSNDNIIEYQHVTNSAGGAVVLTGATSYARPSPIPYAVRSLPSASVYKNQCISITGSTTGNTLACSTGSVWQWVNGNRPVSN